jgi:hypothetical protein
MSTLLGGLTAGLAGQNAQAGATAATNEALNNSTEDHRSEAQKEEDEFKKELSQERAKLSGGQEIIGYDEEGNPITAYKPSPSMVGPARSTGGNQGASGNSVRVGGGSAFEDDIGNGANDWSDGTPPASSAAPKFSGSGPTPGVIAITDSTSVGALRNYYPSGGGVEFVYDPTTNTFAVGKPTAGLFDGSPHQQLVQSIGANDTNIVGGTFSRGADGSIVTTENSGHYGQNWTPQIWNQFQQWLSNRVGVPVNHQPWGSK